MGFFILILSGCDLVKDVRELVAENGQFESSLREKHGLKPLISSKLDNGRLSVNVILSVDEVGDMIVKEVHEILVSEARAAFTENVDKLTISIGN